MSVPAAPVPPTAARTPGHGSVQERLAQQARQKPPVPAAKRWLWIVVLGLGAAIALAQLFGLTSSPVEDKMRRGKPTTTQPEGSPAATPSDDGQGTTR